MDFKSVNKYMNENHFLYIKSKEHDEMMKIAEGTRKLCAKFNKKYRNVAKANKIFCQIIGEPVGKNFMAFIPFYADYGKNIHIGDNVFFNGGCHFQDQGGIYIGNNTMLGHNVVIITVNHALNANQRDKLLLGPVKIGSNVWIGSNVTILPGVTIGDNAIIGAGSVVTKDVAANTVVVGNPAKVLEKI